ncbi:MAG TPA: hypothetical protein DHV36_22920 [Desulfobacteraceae bacterium]|nr:hypothetical protein [Desulfobacteraceae bacterium]|tara:strand:- start:749 stop:1390 length:642 start_codon:yes stop_codon:yes gene_type:complete
MTPKRTYYEILDIAEDASFEDIHRAFREIQSIYEPGSLSTYSLFSTKERTAILTEAEQAYQTLTSREKRDAYDRKLVDDGRLSEKKRFANKTKTPSPVFTTGTPEGNGRVEKTVKEKTAGAAFSKLRQKMQAKPAISGRDLKALRQGAKISLADIFEMSRVSITTLRAIESDNTATLPPSIYLKGFLKSYAECLDLDPAVIVRGYMANISQVS